MDDTIGRSTASRRRVSSRSHSETVGPRRSRRSAWRIADHNRDRNRGAWYRAVEGRHHARALFRGQHRLRENRCRGMRHRVMHVEDIEVMIAAHFAIFTDKGSVVVGIFEQTVVIDRHRVEKKGAAWPTGIRNGCS